MGEGQGDETREAALGLPLARRRLLVSVMERGVGNGR